MTILNPKFPEGLDSMENGMTRMDRRNVIDHYKSMSDALIREDLDTKRLPFVVMCENWASDFNIATTIRSSNAFSCREIVIVGDRRYDRRGTVGTHLYEHIQYASSLSEALDKYRSEGYTVAAVDNVEGAESVFEYSWNPKTVMIFGQEQIGLSNEALNTADNIVFIPMTGSTRSLNVGVASGIMMSHYVQQIREAQI